MAEQSSNEREQQSAIAVNANSSANAGNNETDENGVFVAGSMLQTSGELEVEKKRDHSKEDNNVTAGGTDDLQSSRAGTPGTDRAGTAERKQDGDTELNKGLESQAKGGEGEGSFGN